MLVVAHISDLHIDGDDRATERTARVMNYLNTLPVPVDALLVTGDIADHGLAEEYDQVRKLLVTPLPLLHCPGNHDVRGPYREVLLGQPDGDAPINQAHHIGGAVFAMCDSSIPGRDDGLLAEETLDWLDAVITDSEGPVFVCFHHPAVDLAVPYIDKIKQFGTDRLADLVARHPRIVGLLCGHAHTPAASTFAGKPLLVAPGVVSTIVLPWEQGEFINYQAPPMVAFHVLTDDLRLVTHYRAVV